MVLQKPKMTSQQLMNRREVLRAGLESLAQREQRELQGRPQTNTTCRRGAALHSERSKAGNIMKVLAWFLYAELIWCNMQEMLHIILEAVKQCEDHVNHLNIFYFLLL